MNDSTQSQQRTKKPLEEIDGPGICDCDSPEVGRTLAKGTPAEKKYCTNCGGRIRD